jgi:hypothetical protein
MLIELPRRVVLGLALAGLLLGTLGIGYQNSPRGSDGRPVLLSPQVRALERYRGSLVRWVLAYQNLDIAVRKPLEERSDLLTASQSAQQNFEEALTLSQQIEASDPPTALLGLQDQVAQTAQAFIEASLAVAEWVAAPSEENRTAAQRALTVAESRLSELEHNQWVTNSD